MYLSKKLVASKTEDRMDILEKIKQMSPVRWEHINFFGIFDFSEEALKDALDFNPEELFDFDLE